MAAEKANSKVPSSNQINTILKGWFTLVINVNKYGSPVCGKLIEGQSVACLNIGRADQ